VGMKGIIAAAGTAGLGAARGARLASVGAALAIGATLWPTPASAQQITPCDQGTQTYSEVSRPPQHGFQGQQVIELESERDGATIQIGLVRPDVPEGERVPVIVDAGPYFHPMQTLDLRACEPRLTENFVPQGYAVALVAVRGTSDSGGCMDLFGPNEQADLDQAISWLGRQPWSSGSVGMIGISYDGGTPWEVAAFGNRHLKTIVPISGVPDVFELLFGGGTPDWRGPAVLNDIYYAQSVVFYLAGRRPEHTVQVTACPDYATANAAALFSAQTGEEDPFGYWAPRRPKTRIERNYRGSILLVQGLQDWNVNPGLQFPWVGRLDRSGREVRYLLGQWGHAYPDSGQQPERPEYADRLLAWFDRWLKGREVDLGPKVEVEDSEGRWRRAAKWPPPGRPQTLWLRSDGRLGAAPDGAGGSRTLAFDPLHAQLGATEVEPPHPLSTLCGSPNCAAFRSEPFTDPYRFGGLPRLRATVTPTGPAGQLSAYLYALDSEGATRLGWGQVDLRFPRGGDERGAVEPGRPIEVDFRLQPLDAVLRPGARLVLILSQGTAYNRLPSIPNFPVQLEVGGEAGSLAVTPVRAKGGDFFEPGEPGARRRR
jgi:putative CocE/NonD family hydrolase